jgi:hypothetical protein
MLSGNDCANKHHRICVCTVSPFEGTGSEPNLSVIAKGSTCTLFGTSFLEGKLWERILGWWQGILR